MKFCPKCGTKRATEEAKFCYMCGYDFEENKPYPKEEPAVKGTQEDLDALFDFSGLEDDQ